MQTREYVAFRLKRYKAERQISIDAMSAQFRIAKSSLQEYIKGEVNLRSDTIDLLAENMQLTLLEMFSDPEAGSEEAKGLLQAAELLGGLPSERRKEGIRLFLALAALFT